MAKKKAHTWGAMQKNAAKKGRQPTAKEIDRVVKRHTNRGKKKTK